MQMYEAFPDLAFNFGLVDELQYSFISAQIQTMIKSIQAADYMAAFKVIMFYYQYFVNPKMFNLYVNVHKHLTCIILNWAQHICNDHNDYHGPNFLLLFINMVAKTGIFRNYKLLWLLILLCD